MHLNMLVYVNVHWPLGGHEYTHKYIYVCIPQTYAYLLQAWGTRILARKTDSLLHPNLSIFLEHTARVCVCAT
jgi:hypothetical protein